MKARVKVITKVLKSRNFQEDDEFVVRGLEGKAFPDKAKAKKLKNFLARQSVLVEQDLQAMEGQCNPGRLAQVCRVSSLHCVSEGYRMGRSDELAIEPYIKEERLDLQHLPEAKKLDGSEDKLRSPTGRLRLSVKMHSPTRSKSIARKA
jgi:hypothetical protein